MEWGKILLAILCSGLASSMTDWFFGGVLFHDKYNTYPEIWRASIEKSETSAVTWSVVLGFVACAAFILAADLFGVLGWNKIMVLALLMWGAGPVPVLVTNALFIKLHPLVVVSHATGWLVKLLLAATAAQIFLS